MKLQQIFFNPPKISVIDKNKYKKAKKELINNLKTNKFGFLSELNYPRINEINKIAKCLRKFEKVIFLGTGGSSLEENFNFDYRKFLFISTKTTNFFSKM